MKKVLVLAVLATLVSTSAFAAIANTKHDLSNGTTSGGLATDTSEICVFCHTPHGAATGANYLPLWNRNGNTTPVGFYDSTSMNHVTSEPLTQATDAYLCLSCHDGVQFMETLNNAPNDVLTNNSTVIAGAAALTLNMTNDHPIGFVYNAGLDAELKAGPALPFFGAGNNEMWCSTCHDVHGGAAGSPFLQSTNVASALCLRCHNK